MLAETRQVAIRALLDEMTSILQSSPQPSQRDHRRFLELSGMAVLLNKTPALPCLEGLS